MKSLAAAGAVGLYALMCAGIAWRHLKDRRRRARPASASSLLAGRPLLIAYASQTGLAEQLAAQTARLLQTAGVLTRTLPLSEVTREQLAASERALFIASTCGEGDAPDNAVLFVRRQMAAGPPLAELHYAVLALGDRHYANFCGFGRALDEWLLASGASPLFARIEVDNADEAALSDWQHRLSHLAGTSDLPDWQAPAWQSWRLAARRHLNPGSAGGAVFHLELEPAEGPLPAWEAGDLVQVAAPADPQRPREYSISSLPAEGRVQLLVRQERRADGSLGAASGWLTQEAALGAAVQLRLRSHANFRVGGNADRPLILVGNGTGLAGLRAHLKARAARQGAPGCWLLFGERQSRHDAYYREEIEGWLAAGVLARADLVFSRDQPERRYVQHRLREQAASVREWLGRGAAVYVCGSLEGMAGGVEAALVEMLGEAALEQLVEQGRYRRDVY